MRRYINNPAAQHALYIQNEPSRRKARWTQQALEVATSSPPHYTWYYLSRDSTFCGTEFA